MRYIRGLTLIELMIALAIVVIIASIAYPTYREQLRKTRRSDAQTALMDAAAKMERNYTQFGRYSATLASSGISATSPESLYALTATVSGANSQSFTLTATPLVGTDQANDKCANLGIDEAQNKTNSAGLAQNICW